MIASAVGHQRRLARIFQGPRERTMIVALDATLISNGIPDPASMIAKVSAGKPDAVMGFAGLLRCFHGELVRTPTILNLTGSTIRSAETRKELVHDLETAQELDAEAVALHANIGGAHEREMLRNLGLVAAQASRNGLPVLAIMYPRSEMEDLDSPATRARDPQRYAALVAHAVRIGVDLGADVVKTQFTGDVSSFRDVVKAAGSVPIVIAGGSVRTPPELLRMTREALSAGASGICYGRNVFESADAVRVLEALRAVVHEDALSDCIEQGFGS
ncbi:MAG TPA: hypothetical protein VMU34_11870 [Mycobacterium sp.]|nr:hypothetical protein [Mycobacterium sp.]